MKNNNQKCVFCGKPLGDNYTFSVDEHGEIIVCCENCYKLAKLFVGGNAK